MNIQVGAVLQNRWTVTAKLSTGLYSNLFLARSTTDDTEYAIKVDEQWWIEEEKNVYDLLHSGSTPIGIPRVLGHGLEGNAAFLVLPRLGISLHQLWVMSHRRFTHATIAKIAVQAIQRLQFLHAKGIVHGEVVAKNFVTGASGADESTLYLVDYGSALQFTKRFQKGGSFLSTEDGFDSCPRDDLIGLARMLVKLHRGINHTWLQEGRQRLSRGKTLLRHMSWLGSRKQERGKAELTHYFEYMRYVDVLEATQMPDHRLLMGIFKGFLDRSGESNYNRFQWMNLPGYHASPRQ